MTTWILLRGLSREARHWGEFPERLGERLAATVLCPDLPGFGTEAHRPSPSRIAAIVEDVRARLAAQAQPCHLLGLSLGGMLAAAWASAHPDEIAGCVLVNTSLRPFSPFWQRLRPKNYPALLGLALAGEREAESLILATTRNLCADPEAVLADWLAIRRSAPPSRADSLRQLAAALRYRAPDEAPRVPTLVLASARDALVDPRCSRTLARRWSTAYREHPSAGHELPLDDGDWVAEQILAWQAQCSGITMEGSEIVTAARG